MKKRLFWLWLFFVMTLFCSSPLIADECMEGDCDDGIGTGFTEDNKIYEGQWKDSYPHGMGKKYISKDKIVEGRWEKGKLVEEKKIINEKKKND